MRPLRWKVPGFCRAMASADRRMHEIGLRIPVVCALYDWSLGLTWREARS